MPTIRHGGKADRDEMKVDLEMAKAQARQILEANRASQSVSRTKVLADNNTVVAPRKKHPTRTLRAA